MSHIPLWTHVCNEFGSNGFSNTLTVNVGTSFSSLAKCSVKFEKWFAIGKPVWEPEVQPIYKVDYTITHPSCILKIKPRSKRGATLIPIFDLIDLTDWYIHRT